MVRTLLLFRHGKTEDKAPRGDAARALTKRGRRDAAASAARIAALAGRPDAIVTSPARRADETAAILAEVLDFPGTVGYQAAIYGATVASLMRVVRALPDRARTVVLVGHNPGFEELAAGLTGEAVDHLPTAGVAVVEFDLDRWVQVRAGVGHLRGIYEPD